MTDSTTSKALLDKLLKKKVTLEQFLKDCALWAMNPIQWEDLRVIQYPTRPDTEAFRKYEEKPLEIRQQVKLSFYHQNPEIMDYYRQKRVIWWKNKHTLEWLEELKKLLEGTEYIEKIEQKILDFKGWLANEPEEIKMLKKAFKACRVNGSKEEAR